MYSKNLLGAVAGQSSIAAIVMLMLVLTLAAAPLLQQKKVVAERIGAQIALEKADALASALLVQNDSRSDLSRDAAGLAARHYPSALNDAPSLAHADDFTRTAAYALRADATHPFHQFGERDGKPVLRYAVADGAGGVLTIETPLDRERAIIDRFFGQSYISASTIGYILIGLAMFGAFALRHYLRTLAQLPLHERREAVLAGLGAAPRRRRNLLPWLTTCCALVFVADVVDVMHSVGTGYVLVVMLSLYSSRHWHVTAVAALGAVLLLATPIITPYNANWWSYLEAHAASVFAILLTGFFGSAHMRKSQAEAAAMTDAARSRTENEALRSALERAEAAEAANRAMVEEMREAQERFQRAVAGAQDALFEFNLNTGEMWYSPQFRAMLGFPADAQDDAPLETLIHPEDAALVGKAMSDHLRSGAPYDIEYRLRKCNGDWLWVRSRASAERDAQQQPLWLAGSIRDITAERAAREAMVRATAEAEAASRAKSTFLATMSHEIRTPMNGVIGMAGLLLETQLDRAQREYAETIRASADSLLTILNDILDFSKIEAGKLDIETLELDLRSNVEDVGAMLAFQAAAKGLELVVDVRPGVPERVLGDPQRIRQCLLNLVGNAIKFTNSGEVVLEVCSVGRQNGRALVHFEVRDSGIGVAPDALDKLFQPFTQADSSTTRRFGGTGLGLSIVRRLVELMGGQVGAQSEMGVGSAFWFTLPLEPVVGDEADTVRHIAPSGKRVLLVDDNETNRRVLSSQMTHAGYQVATAARGQEALALLREAGAAYDVVVLDYHMPDMDGAMLGSEIVRARDIAPTRLMLLTSLDRSGDMQRFAEIGFCAYLTKPVRTRELLECLRRALSHEAEDWHMHSQPIITRGTLVARDSRRSTYSGRVLLVEDNAINQRVARRFLERLGCEVDVVGDGAQAIEAYQRAKYAFILMDMQMPVMDGLEATRRIRELELTSGAKHTPIVALTANAMMGTLERCLEAGMDDYLTKPLDISRLQDSLDRFLAHPTGLPLLTAKAPIGREPGALDAAVRERMSELSSGDAEFVAEILDAFFEGGAEALGEMQAAVASEAPEALARAAHKLKGASANLHIEALAALARELELQAKNGALREAQASIAAIDQELARVRETLAATYRLEPRRKAS